MSSTSQALGPNEPPGCRTGSWVNPTGDDRVSWAVQVASALPMSYPAALHFTTRPASTPGAGTVVFVHGSLDRGDSFRRAMRRLPEFTTLAYDRRGYQGSRAGGVVDLGGPHRRSARHRRRGASRGRRRPGGGHRAQPGRRRGARRRAGVPGGLRLHRGLRATHAVAGLPPTGRGPVAPALPTTPAWRRSGSSAAWWARQPGPACTEDGRARATGRRAGAGGRPARHAGRGPALRRHRARRARGLRSGRPDVEPPITDGRWNGWATTSPVRSSTRSPMRSTAPTCRTPTTSPP